MSLDGLNKFTKSVAGVAVLASSLLVENVSAQALQIIEPLRSRGPNTSVGIYSGTVLQHTGTLGMANGESYTLVGNTWQPTFPKQPTFPNPVPIPQGISSSPGHITLGLNTPKRSEDPQSASSYKAPVPLRNNKTFDYSNTLPPSTNSFPSTNNQGTTPLGLNMGHLGEMSKVGMFDVSNLGPTNQIPPSISWEEFQSQGGDQTIYRSGDGKDWIVSLNGKTHTVTGVPEGHGTPPPYTR